MKTPEKFFEEYALASMNGNPQEISGFYAENVMISSNQESTTFSNDGKFLEWLQSVSDFNKKSGLQKMLVRQVEASAIGSNFTKATVTWGATFLKQPDKEISFDIHYIVRHSDDNYKILHYISEEDQEELMKEEGVSES